MLQRPARGRLATVSVKRRILLLVGVVAAVLLGACAKHGDEVARVGKHRVDLRAFQSYLEAVTGERWQAVEGRVAARLLDQFLDQEVVAAAVRRDQPMRIPIDPGQRSATIRRLLNEACGPVPPVPDAQVNAEVTRRLTQTRRRRAHVRQMLLPTVAAAREARRQLEAGADWVDVSRAVSEAPNASSGGELGLVEKGTLPEELDQVIFKLRPGEISQPVQSQAGFHLFQVLEVIPGGPPARSEVEAQVRRDLEQQNAHRFVRECVDRLAAEVGVEVEQSHLWFSYDGRYAEGTHEEQ